ncbi:MAG: serine protease [Rhodobacter sp.]|nr:serine protease [Rhodobacter sp.]
MTPGLAACAVCVLAGIAGQAIAEDTPHIGRLSHAGFKTKAHCTAILVQDGHIATAAHCLPEAAGDTVAIALGYDRGSAASVIRAPGTAFRSDGSRDLAVLCHASDDRGAPLASGIPAPGTQARIAGYGIPRVHALQIRPCKITANSGPAFSLACPSPPGTSGGPVLTREHGTDALVGIVSATSPDRTVAMSVTAADIARLCAE